MSQYYQTPQSPFPPQPQLGPQQPQDQGFCGGTCGCCVAIGGLTQILLGIISIVLGAVALFIGPLGAAAQIYIALWGGLIVSIDSLSSVEVVCCLSTLTLL